MKRLFWLLTLPLLLLAACEENVHNEDTKYADWQPRNDTFITQKRTEAKAAIAAAKAQWGEDWEEHCAWRLLRDYSVTDATAPELVDTVCVEIVERGTGSGCPLYSDEVQVNYLKRLMPTVEHPEGKVVEHSGMTIRPEDVFNTLSAATITKVVSDDNTTAIHTTTGETTAFMQMHIGDRWKLYIPSRLAYGASSSTTIPAHSAIIVEVRLMGYTRKQSGTK